MMIFPALARAQRSSPPNRAGINPSIARLAPNEECLFRVILAPKRLYPALVADNVTWSVNGIPGGNDLIGTINKNGTYHAPKIAPKPREIHICAIAEDASNSHLWATVIMGDAQPTYEMVAKWEEPDDGSVHLKRPFAIAIEQDGNLIIVDEVGSQVLRYTPEGEFLETIGLGGGDDAGQFQGPRHVVIDTIGNIFISDVKTGPPRIQVFSPDGEVLHAFAEKGVAPGQVMDTGGMALDPDGRLFVADADSMRVNTYTHDGQLIQAWERDGTRIGQFNLPYGIIADPNGDIFISSFYGPCQKFTNGGDFLFAFAQPAPPDGPVAYTSATGDQWGNIFLVVRDAAGLVHNSMEPEPKPARVMKFNNNGDLITTFLLWDDECGDNRTVVDKNDRIYVLFNRDKKVGVAIFEPR